MEAQPPGGLVTALEPILRTHRGAWVGWAGIADATSIRSSTTTW